MKFHIPESMSSTMVELIINTDSIDQWDEKQYWFDIWDYMSPEQQKRLQNILQIEKDKLDALFKKYENEISKLDQKLLNEVKNLNKEQIYNLTFN